VKKIGTVFVQIKKVTRFSLQMHLLYVITHTIIKNSNLKIKHQNMFKYPKSANSLGKIKKMLLQQQQQQHKHGGAGEFQVQHFMYFMEN